MDWAPVSARALSTRNDDPQEGYQPAVRQGPRRLRPPARAPASSSREELEHAAAATQDLLRSARRRQLGRCPPYHRPTPTAPARPGRCSSRCGTPAVNPERYRLHQRPRHQHRTGRCRGDGSDQTRLRRTRPQAGDQQHQKYGWPFTRGQRRGRADRHRPVDPAQRRPSDDQLSNARPGVRPRLCAEYRPQNASARLSNSFGFGGHH